MLQSLFRSRFFFLPQVCSGQPFISYISYISYINLNLILTITSRASLRTISSFSLHRTPLSLVIHWAAGEKGSRCNCFETSYPAVFPVRGIIRAARVSEAHCFHLILPLCLLRRLFAFVFWSKCVNLGHCYPYTFYVLSYNTIINPSFFLLRPPSFSCCPVSSSSQSKSKPAGPSLA